MNNTLTCLKGVRVGHATHANKLTGCTVIMFDRDLPVAYKSYGGAPGTFNTEILGNGKTFYKKHCLFIAGGSLAGLTSAATIIDRMIKHKIGYRESSEMINPSTSGAIVFDLGVHIAQYDAKYGAEAFDNLSEKPVARGNVGAGTGTSVGKFSYTKDGEMLGMKAGVGCARINLGNGVIVTALSVVNAIGNVINRDGTILAGNRNDKKTPKFRTFETASEVLTGAKMNTTISIVGINVDLKTRENYETVAHLASQGHVRAINPVNTSVDGDTVFVFSTEEITDYLSPLGKKIEKSGDWPTLGVDIIGNTAANAVRESIYDACLSADSIKYHKAHRGIVPSSEEY